MPAVTTVARRLGGRLRRGRAGRWVSRLLDGDPAAERTALGLLITLTVLLDCLSIAFPTACPPSALALPLILAGFVLHTGLQLILLAPVTLGLVADALYRRPYGLTPGSATVVAAAAAIVLLTSRYRSRLGLRGTRGDSMLLELSERTRALGRLPDGLLDWRLHRAVAPAGGTFFSGDFLLASHRPDRDLLEVVLVDVSGKGSRAAARSMHLSGAFAMLLGSVQPESFLPKANEYLARLGWDEEFATAVHLALHPSSGRFRIFNAGHPPAAHYRRAEGGDWQLREESGAALGVLSGAAYPAATGQLALGDSLLLYSDGLVEVPGEDIDKGIGRLLAAATPLLRYGGAADPAAELLGTVGRNISDDRTLVVVRRLGAGA
ncbi:PP2C family protein-serine/threonine phosphatase [Kitasatospora atroaurantiaca]|uniref:Stage II sporulation protein E n=1 Tax=Kitasatospora atroaurantiaca TaxID=285545 RepID=A0A561ETE5_9ACTN|nr:PP2C family protein-serine/threonine phosphatase [Kitasatospora atroaurantiaca]TWE18886.1 stage II sporulation protein E [Kitasatospora atroaurantiaca]